MRASQPIFCATSRSRLLFELSREPMTSTRSQRGAMQLDRVLAVLRGVADVLLLRLGDASESALAALR